MKPGLLHHLGLATIAIAVSLVTLVTPACPPTTDYSMADGETHIFASPRWPRSYLSNEYCSYHLSTIPGNKIYIKFLEFGVEQHVSCTYDKVKIFDGAYTTNSSFGKYCGQAPPPAVLSSAEDVLVTFESDPTLNDDGFRGVAVSIGSGTYDNGLTDEVSVTTINEEKGTLMSEGYPYKYKASHHEQFVVTSTEDGSLLRISFRDFDVEPSYGCKFDYVAVYDGNSTTDQLIGRYCGGKDNQPPKPIQSTTESLCVEFVTDDSNEFAGFLADFATVPVGSQLTSNNDDGNACQYYDFPCLNGQCVHEALICDGIDDCGDNSDEFCLRPKITSSDAGALVFVACFIAAAVLCIVVATVVFCYNAKKQNRTRNHMVEFSRSQNGMASHSVHSTAPLAPGQHMEKGIGLSYITYATPR